ncbi:MFS transporter [Acidithiobacillus caldus]
MTTRPKHAPGWLAGSPAARLLAAYAPLGLPLAFGALPVYLLIPHLYATRYGMSLALLGGLLLVLRLADAVLDPLIGHWSDLWAEVAGSRLRLILAGIPGMILGFFLLFQPWQQVGLVASLALALAIFYVSYSLTSLNYQALGAELTQDYNGRTWFTTAREAGALVGVLLAAALPQFLERRFGAGPGLDIFVLVFALTLLTAFAPLWRPAMRRPVTGNRKPWWTFYEPLRRPPLRRLLEVYTLSQMGNAIAATLFFFFVDEILHTKVLAPLFLLVYFLSGALGMPVWLALSTRLGKARTWSSAMLLSTLAFTSAVFLGPGDAWAYGVICVLTGLTLGADQALPPSILADHTDYDSDARAGNYFGLFNWVAKAATALGAGIILPLLQWSGFRPGEHLWLLSIAYAIVPALIKVAAILLMELRAVEAQSTVVLKKGVAS